MSRPIVAIVGLQNVGKSMLFNRIVGGRVAVVSEEPGVTRDRNIRPAEWKGRPFLLVDTGGWIPARAEGLDALVIEQTRLAIDEADALLFVVDAEVGAGEAEMDLARLILRRRRPCLLVANKGDRLREGLPPGLESLGLGDAGVVSAAHGTGVSELLDRLVGLFPDTGSEEPWLSGVRVAIVGRPNVGKSSLVNRLLGSYRSLVDETPGTTRDSIDTPLEAGGQRYVLVDTAGIRRRARIGDRIEFYSHLRSVRSIENCDVAIVLMDATEGVTQQDVKVAAMAHEAKRGSILVFNKVDALEERREAQKMIRLELERLVPFNQYSPVCFVSAKEGWGTGELLAIAHRVDEERRKRVSTGDLNRMIRRVVETHPPPSGPHPSRVFYATQVGECPPTFVVFVSRPENIQRNYIRYLMNQIRRAYRFEGTPIQLEMRKRA
jgi:GTP-binding protein